MKKSTAEPGMGYLGVDMGGSASRVCLTLDTDPPLIWSLSGGNLALNPRGVRDVLFQLISETKPSAACVGIAGLRTAMHEVDWLKLELARMPCPVKIVTDAELALLAAFGTNADGIVVCAGTGSVAVVRSEGVVHLVGGHGFLLDDGGSAYDIGRRIVAAALRDRDSGGIRLTKEVETVLNGSIDDFVRRVYSDPSDRQLLARLAEHVASLRSPGAKQVVTDAAESLAGLAQRAQDRFGELPVRMLGGVFANAQIATVMQERFDASHAELRPEMAAARLAEGLAA